MRSVAFQFIVKNFGSVMKEDSFVNLAKDNPLLMREILNTVSNVYFGEKKEEEKK